MFAIAKDLSVAHTTVARWLRGTRISAEQVMQLAAILGVSANWLFTGAEEPGAVVQPDLMPSGEPDANAAKSLRDQYRDMLQSATDRSLLKHIGRMLKEPPCEAPAAEEAIHELRRRLLIRLDSSQPKTKKKEPISPPPANSGGI